MEGGGQKRGIRGGEKSLKRLGTGQLQGLHPEWGTETVSSKEGPLNRLKELLMKVDLVLKVDLVDFLLKADFVWHIYRRHRGHDWWKDANTQCRNLKFLNDKMIKDKVWSQVKLKTTWHALRLSSAFQVPRRLTYQIYFNMIFPVQHLILKISRLDINSSFKHPSAARLTVTEW